jgi:hypothetical protein
MIVDDGRGELRRGVPGSADQVHDEAVDESLQPDRLALGIQVGGELALADGGLEATDQRLVKLAPDVLGPRRQGRVNDGAGDEGQPDERLLAPGGIERK